MKKQLFAMAGLLLMMACGSSDKSNQPDQQTQAAPAPNKKFILKAANSKYVAIGSDTTLIANEPIPTKAEVFEKVDMGNGKFALKASNGKFVCDDRTKKDRLYVNRPTAGEWESFEIIAVDQMSVNIKASTGKFVTNDQVNGDAIVADRDSPSSWETFVMEEK